MQVHYQESGAIPAFKNAVITIGTFDGVHLGHRQIITQLIEEAKNVGGETVIISFFPHPRSVITNSLTNVKLLGTLKEKIALLSSSGIDHLVIIPFNLEFANQSADEYISNFLVKLFHPHTIIIGYDHRFGKNRVGDYHLLVAYGKELGFAVKEIPEHILNEVVISSTKIRRALLDNDINTANKFLGYEYFFEGDVIKGNQLGRTIGYPTANLNVASDEKLIPGNGVYAVHASILEENKVPVILKGMMNIGVRPTVDGVLRVIEVNLFHFDQDIYGKTLKVSIHSYLRAEQKFSGLEALKEQLGKDQLMAEEALNN
ncbi:MAG: bifunctional riboflavin kinase/FAD synthetase [Bacteroidota bacterium]